MIKRKARNKINKGNLDMTKPLDITQFGGEDDPCFGKSHDPRASECQRCGDAEVCSIICSQKMHIIRELEEKKGKYKDIQPDELKTEKTLNQLILDKLKSKDGKMKLISLAGYIKTSLPEYKDNDTKEIRNALKVKLKVSSLFEIYKQAGISYIKLKKQ